MQNIYCTVDCTEFKIECWRNFARQGNTFSSYTHCNILKCLIAVTPNSGACFVSDLFEGDINDVQIFKECGNLRYLHPGDVVMVDDGLTARGLLNPRQVTLTIPSLKGRTSLTAAEELETWCIAKARTHVEHSMNASNSLGLSWRRSAVRSQDGRFILIYLSICLFVINFNWNNAERVSYFTKATKSRFKG